MAYTFDHDWFSWNIPSFERFLLPRKGKPIHAMEVGSHEGRSAVWMLENVLTHPEAKLTCIDYKEDPHLAPNLAATGAASKVDVRIGYSRDVLSATPYGVFDVAYIDGSHWACDVLEDAVLAFRRLKVGGIIAFDDYLWDDPAFDEHGTPKVAIDAFLACYAHKLEVLERGHQVWVRKTAD